MINPSDINILIVEDEPDLRELLAAKFRVFGFNVDTAHSGSSAWDKIVASTDLHIVVTDVRMPDGSGTDILEKCKQRNVEFPKVFVISAFSDVPTYELFANGAEGFMTKPFDTKLLLDVIRKSLLSPEDRWRSPNSTPPKARLDLEMGDLKDAISTQNFGAARGGFFMRHSLAADLDGQLVAFKLDFAGKQLEGSGVVRWMYPDSKETKSEFSDYIGIELVQLTGESIELFKGLVGEELPVSYIPAPPTISK